MIKVLKDIKNSIVKHKALFIILTSIIAILLIVLFVCKLLFIPYKLSVTRNSTLYQYEEITKDDIEVKTVTRLGKTETIDDYEFTNVVLSDTNTDIEIKWNNLSTTFNCVAVGYTNTVATYEFPETTYQGDEVNKDVLKVVYSYVDGSKHEQTNYEIIENPNYFNSNKLVVNTHVGEDTLKCKNYVEVDHIDVSRAPIMYSGETVGNKLDYIRFNIIYKDGEIRTIEGSETTIEDKTLRLGNNELVLTYHDNEYKVNIDAVIKEGKATIIYGDNNETQYVDDKFKFDHILIEYTDDSSETISFDKVKFNEDTTLKYGLNKFTFTYNDQTFEFSINAVERDIVKAELIEYKAYINREPEITKARLTFDNDKTIEVSGYDINITSGILNEDSKYVEFTYHEKECKAEVVTTKLEITNISIPNTTKLFENSTIPNCTLTITFSDNSTINVTPSQLGISNQVLKLGDNILNVEYEGMSYELILTAIKDSIVTTTYTCDTDIYEGDKIPKLTLTITFDSGNIETVSSDEIIFNENTLLLAGINNISYIYNDYLGVIQLNVLEKEEIVEEPDEIGSEDHDQQYLDSNDTNNNVKTQELYNEDRGQ